jgi:hypothetical protein
VPEATNSREDMNELLDPLIEFAKKLLEKNGEFYPFGNFMTTDGTIELMAAMDGEQPDSAELIDLLAGACRKKAEQGSIRASALCYDVRWRGENGQPTDAIAVAIEHRDADPITVVVPYSKGRFGGWNFEPLVATAGQRRVFAARP